METFSLKKLEYNKDFIEIDEQIVYVKKCPGEELVVKNYNDLPDIQGLKKLSKVKSLNFFSEILADERRIRL
jgi:hypothetical protein